MSISSNLNNFQNEFKASTLVLPAVSVGNVGQLATDLLLENLNPRPIKLGQLFHAGLEPVVGNGGNGDLMTACEVFHHPQQKLVILQFHSAVLHRKQKEFVTFLIEWIQKSNFKEVLCLGSSLASLRNDIQLNEPAMRYLGTQSLNPEKLHKIQTFQWVEMEPASGLNSTEPKLAIPGGGIAKDLFVACSAAQIPNLTLIIFASDGENTPDSMALLRNANQLYEFIPPDDKGTVNFQIPSLWDYFSGLGKPRSIF